MKRIVATLAAVVLLAILGVALVQPVTAAPSAVPWEQRFAELEAKVGGLETQVTSQAAAITSLTTKLTAAEGNIASLTTKLTAAEGNITSLTTKLTAAEGNIASLTTRLSAVEGNNALKLGLYVDVVSSTLNGVVGPNILFTGANLHVRSGSGNTEGVLNGLGNLIVGYNESDRGDVTGRTGSHNLVAGNGNHFSSHGGLIAGQLNTISAPFATVTGGVLNSAEYRGATVSGGRENTASGYSASVSGGWNNAATDYYSAVSGGQENTASDTSSSVSGGRENTAPGEGSSVSGGWNNHATGRYSAVSGGRLLTAPVDVDYSWYAGSYHTP